MLLLDIVEKKRERVAKLKKAAPVDELIQKINDISDFTPHHLFNSLKKNKLSLIAESKKASPSMGVIVQEYDPSTIVQQYVVKGAHAISILTEEEFFQGSINDLQKVRQTTDLPILRKDFIFDEYEIFEAKAFGASAILLIARILSKGHLKQLYLTAKSLGLDVLLEIHNEKDLELALEVDAEIIGINSRDLDTLKIDHTIIEGLIGKIPKEKMIVAESGISSASELEHLVGIGANAVLIGTSLLKDGPAARDILDFIKSNN